MTGWRSCFAAPTPEESLCFHLDFSPHFYPFFHHPSRIRLASRLLCSQILNTIPSTSNTSPIPAPSLLLSCRGHSGGDGGELGDLGGGGGILKAAG
jgi:hypothetical protein